MAGRGYRNDQCPQGAGRARTPPSCEERRRSTLKPMPRQIVLTSPGRPAGVRRDDRRDAGLNFLERLPVFQKLWVVRVDAQQRLSNRTLVAVHSALEMSDAVLNCAR